MSLDRHHQPTEMTDRKHEGIRAGVKSGRMTWLDSVKTVDLLIKRRWPTSTCHRRTIDNRRRDNEKLDGYATVHIVLGLGGEQACAHPASRDRASHRRFFLSVSVHAFSLRPTEGESAIRKDPRGDLRGEGRSLVTRRQDNTRTPQWIKIKKQPERRASGPVQASGLDNCHLVGRMGEPVGY